MRGWDNGIWGREAPRHFREAIQNTLRPSFIACVHKSVASCNTVICCVLNMMSLHLIT